MAEPIEMLFGMCTVNTGRPKNHALSKELHTHTTVKWPLVWDYPGRPVP